MHCSRTETKQTKNKSMREATIAQRSSVQSSSCYSVHFESADSFVTRRRPSLARIGLFYSHYNANSVRANAQKSSKRNVLFFFLVCLFVPRADRKQPRAGGRGGNGATRWRDNVTLCCTDAPFITSVTTANSKRPSAAAWNSPIYTGSQAITPAWPQLMQD